MTNSMKTYHYVDFAYEEHETHGDGMVMEGEFEERPTLTWDLINDDGVLWDFVDYVLPDELDTVENLIGIITTKNELEPR